MIDSKHKADDLGTRLEHLMELHEVWSWGLAYLTRSNQIHQTVGQLAEIEKITCALEMLNHQLRGLDNPTEIAQQINKISIT